MKNGSGSVIRLSILLCCLLPCHTQADTVLVAVASNFSEAIKQIVTEFEKDTHHRVTLTFGSSGKFYAQIKNGAPFQVFFSADQDKAVALEREHFSVPDSRFTYATGILVLWSPRKDFTVGLNSLLLNGNFNKLAIANPKLAPYGTAAVQALQNLGLSAAVQSRLVQGESIAQTYQFVRSGNADLGMVALSQVIKRGQGTQWIIPQALYQPIRQDVVLLRAGADNRAAHELLQYMGSKKVQSIIRSYGYGI